MALITVTNLNASGAGSFRQAVLDAASGDTIFFQNGLSSTTGPGGGPPGTIYLGSELVIDKSLTIGNQNLVQTITLSAKASAAEVQADNRALVIDGSGGPIFVTMHGVGARDGVAADGGGIFVGDTDTLTLASATVTGNTATNVGGGVYAGIGSTVNIVRSTVSDNTANAGFGIGGGVFGDNSTLTLSEATVSGNTSLGQGGGVFAQGGTVALTNATVANNTSQSTGGGVHAAFTTVTVNSSTFSGNSAVDGGGGIAADGTAVTLSNSIVAGNSSTNGGVDATEFNGSSINSAGKNLFGNLTGVTVSNTGDDIIGAPLTSVFAAIDPVTGGGQLLQNGGPVATVALNPNGLAVDSGINGDVPGGVTTDARGALRFYDGPDADTVATTDLGAFELAPGMINATLRWYFSAATDTDGDGVQDPGENVTVEVTYFNAGPDATEITWFISEDGGATPFFNLSAFFGIAPFTLPANKAHSFTYTTSLEPQTNQFVVPLLEQIRIDYKYGSDQRSIFTDDITPQDPYLPGAADPAIVAADTVELHGTVFSDANADGTFANPETGVAGVEVKLYADTGSTVGAFDAGDLFLGVRGTTTTDAQGQYHFTGLARGDYIVQVTAANFTTGNALRHLQLSAPGGTTDPDDNVDNDDNGAPAANFATDGVVSLPVRLDYNQEPTSLLGPRMELVSADNAGDEGNDDSAEPSISGDGRYVAFQSRATDLVADGNGVQDIFVYDRDTNTIERVSVDIGGADANAVSAAASISANGRFVAFQSSATDLVAVDGNGAFDIFIRDRDTDTTERVSVDTAGGDPNGASANASTAPDGRFVAFESLATDLIATDGNGVQDIFVYDRDTDTTTLISAVNGTNLQANGASFNASISSNVFGRGVLVAFESVATNLVGAGNDTNGFRDIFVRDTDIVLETSRISVGVGNIAADGDSFNAAISFDSRFVAFESNATTLLGVGNDTNGVRDIFVAELNSAGGNTIAMERVSVASDGTAANGNSFSAAISADGRYVTFESDATNLLGAGNDTNGVRDIFIHDRVTHITRRLSVDDANDPANGGSFVPVISADGRIVAFQSGATDLVAGDGNGATDVFAVTSLAGNDVNTTLDFGFTHAPLKHYDLLWHNTATDALRDWTFAGGSIATNHIIANPADTAWQIAAVDDFNLDSVADIVWQNSTSGDTRVWLMEASGGIASNLVQGNAGVNLKVAATGDFNNDGLADIFWQDTATGAARVWLMSDGVRTSTIAFSGPTTDWFVTGVGDFNGDGTDDVLWRNSADGQFREWTMSNGTFSAVTVLPGIASSQQIAATGDFNGDGADDIVFHDSISGAITEWLMSNGAVMTVKSLGTLASEWKLSGAVDSNQNSTDDLLWHNVTTGQMVQWTMTAGDHTGTNTIGIAPTTWEVSVSPATHADLLPLA